MSIKATFNNTEERERVNMKNEKIKMIAHDFLAQCESNHFTVRDFNQALELVRYFYETECLVKFCPDSV